MGHQAGADPEAVERYRQLRQEDPYRASRFRYPMDSDPGPEVGWEPPEWVPRGEPVSRPHGCGPYCGTCPGTGPDRQEGSRAGRGRGIRLPERDASQPPKDPRFAWLPP